jgi:hypothetical protein
MASCALHEHSLGGVAHRSGYLYLLLITPSYFSLPLYSFAVLPHALRQSSPPYLTFLKQITNTYEKVLNTPPRSNKSVSRKPSSPPTSSAKQNPASVKRQCLSSPRSSKSSPSTAKSPCLCSAIPVNSPSKSGTSILDSASTCLMSGRRCFTVARRFKRMSS